MDKDILCKWIWKERGKNPSDKMDFILFIYFYVEREKKGVECRGKGRERIVELDTGLHLKS